jgi:L-ascorbate metabolism protein UlaG (beta-lactamase superfamily)
VLGPLGHIGSGLAYLATARRQHKSDELTAQQLAWPADHPLPRGLSITWLGTAGLRLAYEGTVVWIDPYVTRLPLGQLIRRKVVPSDEELVTRWIDKADAVLVGHTHFDHALDVPAIAKRFGCKAYGSTSLEHLMGLHGVAGQAVVAEPHKRYEVGPFTFHFVPSLHSKLQLGLGIPYSGELTCDHVDELNPQAYKCGQVWGIAIEVAGLRMYHQGSCDLIEDAIDVKHVDVLFAGISGRRFTKGYFGRIIRAIEPKLIVPTHYDNFFKPLGAPTKFSFNVNLTGFADEVHAVTQEVPMHTLEVGVPVVGT